MRIFLSLALAMTLATGSTAEAEDISLSTMIDTVQVALLDAQNQLRQNNMPPLSEVELKLNAVNTTEGGGSIGFWIFKIGAKSKSESVSEIHMRLTPPAPGSEQRISASAHILEALKSAIFQGAAAHGQAATGQPPLVASEFTIKLRFGVAVDGNGELTLAFPPFEVSGGGSLSNSEVQTIIIKFKDG